MEVKNREKEWLTSTGKIETNEITDYGIEMNDLTEANAWIIAEAGSYVKATDKRQSCSEKSVPNAASQIVTK